MLTARYSRRGANWLKLLALKAWAKTQAYKNNKP
jgi:hypothetical protein